MVTAILHLVEQDGEVLPPRRVRFVDPCASHVGGGCIELATNLDEPMFAHPDELSEDEYPDCTCYGAPGGIYEPDPTCPVHLAIGTDA